MNTFNFKKILKFKFLISKRSFRNFLGAYKSQFKGTGMTFSDFREYIHGDDFRSISWPLTAKMGRPYVKIFEEDRGQNFLLMVDVSASSQFGGTQSKSEAIQQIASLIICLTEKYKDQVSLILFSDQVELYIPPSSGPSHTLKLIKAMHSIQPQSKKTDLSHACHYVQGILKKRAYIFIISDFFTDDFTKSVKMLNKKHEIVGVVIEDILEQTLPSMGLMELQDLETGKHALVDTSSSLFKKSYKENMEKLRVQREKDLNHMGIKHFSIKTNEDVFKPFIQFIQKQKTQ